MSAGNWAEQREAKHSALKKLSKMKESITKHGLAVPFPVDRSKPYKNGRSNRQINRAIWDAPIVELPLAGLIAIQHSVKGPRVEQYIRDPSLSEYGAKHDAAHTPVDHPIVIQEHGKRYIHDGHHRITAEKLRGKTEGMVRFVNFDAASKDEKKAA